MPTRNFDVWNGKTHPCGEKKGTQSEKEASYANMKDYGDEKRLDSIIN